MVTNGFGNLSENDLEKMKEKIQKLLNLTVENGATDAEAATALGKAQAFMEKYNLDMETVCQAGEGVLIQDLLDTISFARWEQNLANAIAKLNMCQVVIFGKDLRIYGRRVNVLATKIMLSWISYQLISMEVHSRFACKPSNIPTKQFKNSFMWGATQRIAQRISEMQSERLVKDEKCQALVINRTAEARNFYEECNPGSKLVKRSSAHFKAGIGYLAGQDAGYIVDLSGNSKIEIRPKLIGAGG